MRRLSVALFALSLASAPALVQQPGAAAPPQPRPAANDVWRVDSAHSSAGFSVRHMMISTVRGTLGPISGTVEYDGSSVANAKVDITIDVRGINTGNGSRDKDLRGAGFFDVDTYPAMTFKSKRAEPAGPASFRLVGDLTIRGVTKEVMLDVAGPSQAVTVRNGSKIGATATTKLNRRDFGLNYNEVIEAGAVVGDEVTVTIDIELNKASS
jgi:polyisoprenoid-binding protein YceI